MNEFEVGGTPSECAWKAVVIILLKKNWSFMVDFDDENNCVYVDLLNGKQRLTFEL